MKTDEPGIRKAAILVSSLDRPSAQALLRQLGTADAGRVVQMMTQLGDIPATERRRVLDEFFRSGPKPPVAEAKPQALPQPEKPAPAKPEPRAAASAAAGRPRRFAFLDDVAPASAARLLAAELPQTIALVLSHLPPQQSGHILSELDSALQVDVLRRLVDLDQIDPGIVDEIEQVLVERLAEVARFERPRTSGMTTVAGIFAASPETIRPQLFENLTERDRALAEQLTPDPIDFAEFARLDDTTLGTIFRSADMNLVALALMGASPAFVLRVLRFCPAAEAAWLRGQLESPGPTRLSDVEEARVELSLLASRLAAEGRIRLDREN